MLVDSHCHLTDARFDEDREAALRRAVTAGVSRIVSIASNLEDVSAVLALIEHSDRVWGTAGIHPHEAESAPPRAMDQVARLSEHPRIVAIGECGLDFHYDFSPRDVQQRVFRGQLELARELDMPVVVHSRDCDREMIEVLDEFGPDVRGVLHCFTGGFELLKTGLDAGWYVSLTAIATFASFDPEIVRAIPSDRLMIETDSPYLAPKPHRGKRNEPAYLGLIAERIAEIRAVSVETLARETTRNALTFYSIDDDA